jgi:hypothetical protein
MHAVQTLLLSNETGEPGITSMCLQRADTVNGSSFLLSSVTFRQLSRCAPSCTHGGLVHPAARSGGADCGWRSPCADLVTSGRASARPSDGFRVRGWVRSPGTVRWRGSAGSPHERASAGVAEMGEGQASVRLLPAPRVPDRQARPLPPPLRAQARRMKAFARAGIAAAVRRTGLYAALGRSAWRRGIVILLYHRVGAPAGPSGGPSVRGEPPPQASSPEGRACAAQLPLRLRRRPSHLCRR